jgi:MFS family permease
MPTGQTHSETGARVGTVAGSLTGWAALAVVLVLYTLSYLDRTLFSLVVQPIKATFGISDVQIGLLQGVSFALFYAVIGLPAGWAVDRYSRRWIIFLGVAIWSASTMWCGMTRSFTTLALSRAGIGAGEATLAPATFSLIPEWFSKSRLATATGVYYLGSALGSSLALLLGGLTLGAVKHWGAVSLPVIGRIESWQTAFLVLGAPGIVLGLLIFLVRENTGRRRLEQEGPESASWGEFLGFVKLRHKLLLCHLLGFPLLGFCILGLHAWTPAYMGRRFGLQPEEIGPLLAITSVVGGVFHVVLGMAADALFKRGRKDAFYRVQIVATLVFLPFTVLSFWVSNAMVFIALIALGAGSLSFGGPSVAALQLVTPPRMRGKIMAIYLLMIGTLGTAAGPLIPALVSDRVFHDQSKLGLSLAIVVGIVAPVAVLLLAFGMKHLRAALTEESRPRAQNTRDGAMYAGHLAGAPQRPFVVPPSRSMIEPCSRDPSSEKI